MVNGLTKMLSRFKVPALLLFACTLMVSVLLAAVDPQVKVKEVEVQGTEPPVPLIRLLDPI